MERQLTVGIAGYGFHGQSLHEAAQHSHRIDVVAILEPDAAKHPSGASDIRSYTMEDEFFRHEGLGGVIIASPVPTHEALVTMAGQRRLPIELEKPMAVTSRAAERIKEIARSYRTPLMVGMTTHYRPEMLLADTIIESGELGEIRSIHEEIVIGLEPEGLLGYVAEKNQGGVLLENGIHLIDHLLWYGGPIARWLSAMIGSRFLGGYHEDIAVLHAMHENGIESVSHLQWMPYKESNGFKMKLYGTKGCLEVRGLDSVRINRGGRVEVMECYDDKGDYIERFAERHLPGVVNQLDDFAAFILDGKEPRVPVKHVLDAHYWLDAAYEMAGGRR